MIAVILALFVRTWVFQAFQIPTGSMEPNLLIGDHLIVNKMIFAPAVTAVERAILPDRDIRRGDIIVFKYPKSPIATSSSASSACPATGWSSTARRSTSTASRSSSRTRTSSSRPRPPVRRKSTMYARSTDR